jgi:hypothetical protein
MRSCYGRWSVGTRDEEAPAEGVDCFLFMHHPPFDTGPKAMERIGLTERDAFWQVLSPHAARIRHVFFGHGHRPVMGSWRGIGFATSRAINHQVWFDLTSEDQTPGSFESPAYAIVLVDAERLVVHPHDFLDASPKFALEDSPVDDWIKAHIEA